MLELEEETMKSKIIKKTGIHKRVFKNLDDIFQFEYELMRKEMTVAGVVTVETPVPIIKNYQKVSYYDPKTKEFTRIDPNDPEQVEYVTKKGMILGAKQMETELKSVPQKLMNDPKSSHRLEAEPIIFEAKGKTPPSVPYLRVFVESSIGDEKVIHYVHNRTKSQ